MTHKQKTTLARKLITRDELKFKISIWDSKGWKLRKEAIASRVARKQHGNKLH